jgi:hypothetical protein
MYNTKVTYSLKLIFDIGISFRDSKLVYVRSFEMNYTKYDV